MSDSRSIDAIFCAAIEMETSSQRQSWLDQACDDDAELRGQVNRLLQAHFRGGSIIDSPAHAIDATVEQPARLIPGTQIGPYKLLQQIGEGGMGTVFMAEQTHPVQRKVALKLIKPGMDSRQIIARFEAERQALAMMDHVNIARVLDAGATASGRPYFVMELVHGIPITNYCDDNRLTPRQRLELFVPVCQAIQHAHQKGIIHRDIKPSNVMVTRYDGKPVPKVIDFGVAKATEQKLTEQTLFTQYGTLVGTLEYMSPEQAEMNALGVDTRSDIYSLGVLLYELLTGSTPLSGKQMKEAAYGEILRLIKEEEPPKPSTRLSDSGEALASISAQRQTEPAKLSKLMRGELDWIVMKTLEKDRNRRYETASGLGRDVQHYLNDEPVIACPPTVRYRMWKFARRNKGALVTTALVGATLVSGVILLAISNVQIKQEQNRTAGQRTRAELALGAAKENLQLATNNLQRADANLELANGNLDLALEALDEVFMKEIEVRVREKRELSPRDREFLQKGLRFYEQFTWRNNAHAGLQAATAKANRRAGYLRLELSQWPEAEAHFRKAISLQERPVLESPQSEQERRELTSTYHGLSIALSNTGSLEEAETTCRHAITLRRQLSCDFPAKQDHRVYLGHCLWQLRIILTLTGKFQEAEASVREAIKLYTQLAVESPDVLYYQQEIAFSHRHLARVLTASNRLPEALECVQQAADLYTSLVTQSPENPVFQQEAGHCHVSLGEALNNAGDIEGAEGAFRKALAIRKHLAVTSGQAEHRQHLVEIQGLLADFLRQHNRQADAEEVSIDVEVPPVPSRSGDNDVDWAARAYAHFNRQDWEPAIACFSKAIDLAPKVHGNWWHRGHSYLATAQWAKAAVDFGKTIEDWPDGGEGSYWRAIALAQLGQLDNAMADLQQAREKGFNHVGEMKNDPRFDPLRTREDYGQLLEELERKN